MAKNIKTVVTIEEETTAVVGTAVTTKKILRL